MNVVQHYKIPVINPFLRTLVSLFHYCYPSQLFDLTNGLSINFYDISSLNSKCMGFGGSAGIKLGTISIVDIGLLRCYGSQL